MAKLSSITDHTCEWKFLTQRYSFGVHDTTVSVLLLSDNGRWQGPCLPSVFNFSLSSENSNNSSMFSKLIFDALFLSTGYSIPVVYVTCYMVLSRIKP